MVATGTKITKADLDELAALANAKLAPATPYAFNAFAGNNRIGLPADIGIIRQFPGFFPAGSKVTARVYGYKTIAGVKTYSSYYTLKAYYDDRPAGSDPFSLAWSWEPVADGTRPDGYIFALANPLGNSLIAWQDVGAAHAIITSGDMTDPSWKFDSTLDAGNAGFPDQNLPSGRGAWLKPLNRIHGDLFTSLDIFGGARVFDDTWLVSGPWCVSVAPKCYLYLGTAIRKAAYKNLKFIYSESDSPSGSDLAPEADMFGDYIAVNNGVNNFNWDANVKINGTIKFYALPEGQTAADWNISVSDPGITWQINSHDVFAGPGGAFPATSIEFTFADIQYTVGTPIVITVTPLSGGSVWDDGGALVNCVFTGDVQTYATADTIAIHNAGPAAKAVALPATLDAITFTDPSGALYHQESHHRCFCNGVFVANTLPTLGPMPFLDMDLPQYNPNPFGGRQAGSSQRIPRNELLPYMPGVDYMASRWPVLRDTDFVPDNLAGRPVNGSAAWQQIIFTKYQGTQTVTDTAPAGGFVYESMFVPGGAADARFLANNPDVTLYVKAGGFPTLVDFDAHAAGGQWLSLAESLPGFATDTDWFIGVYNPTAGDLDVTVISLHLDDATPPNGTFFPTTKDDDGHVAAQLEADSFHFADPDAIDLRPIPLFGYCVSALTVTQ